MTPQHGEFTMRRHYAAAPATVFRLWAEPDLKREWFAENDGPGWTMLDYGLDFRVGGREHGHWKFESGDTLNETRYFDILPERRIVMAYSMARPDEVFSVSLVTITFVEADGGTDLTVTEQMTVLDGSDKPENRESGWRWILDGLGRALEARAT